MLFSSFPFLLFLPLAIAILAIARYRSRPALLVAMSLVSLFFYGWFRADYVLILIGSALANYLLAMALERRPDTKIFAVGIVLNVALLGAFKYLDFIIGNADAMLGEHWPLPHIVLPLALSFITFEQISFLSDVKSGRVKRSRFIEYLAFVTFFPKLKTNGQ